MLSDLSLTQRGLILLGAVAVLFVLARIAIITVNKINERRAIKALNADTGTPDGASRGQDETHNREWFQFVHSTRPSEEERYKWADAILPDGSVHNEDGTVINARRPPSQPTPPTTPPGSTAQDSTAGKDSGQA